MAFSSLSSASEIALQSHAFFLQVSYHSTAACTTSIRSGNTQSGSPALAISFSCLIEVKVEPLPGIEPGASGFEMPRRTTPEACA